jgi:hypothetical protein
LERLQSNNSKQLWEQELKALAAALLHEFKNKNAAKARPDFDLVPKEKRKNHLLVDELGFRPQQPITKTSGTRGSVQTGKRSRGSHNHNPDGEPHGKAVAHSENESEPAQRHHSQVEHDWH